MGEKRPVVLVVDDEPILAMSSIEMFEEAGYEAVYASNADDAIRILEERSDIALVFTDIQMPGSMDGLKLAAAVRNRWPPIRLIVASGRFNPKPDELPDGAVFLPKPFDRRSVAESVRRAMA